MTGRMQLDDEGVSTIPKRPLRYKKTPLGPEKKRPARIKTPTQMTDASRRGGSKGGNAYLLPPVQFDGSYCTT